MLYYIGFTKPRMYVGFHQINIDHFYCTYTFRDSNKTILLKKNQIFEAGFFYKHIKENLYSEQ